MDQAPTGTGFEAFLKQFHAKFPSCTPQAFAAARGPDGRNSYDVLADEARDGDSILDLACGDGFLLALLRSRVGSARLTGVDMSEGELAVARRTLEGLGVELVEARAQELPVADGAFDLVVSHLALMLMEPVAPVVSEIARVLRAGGRFRAVVSGGSRKSEVNDAFVSALDAALAADGKEFFKRLGDPRLRSGEGIHELFEGQGSFTDIRIEDLAIASRGDAAAAHRTYMSLYDVGLLSDGARAQFSRNLMSAFEAIERQRGFLDCHWGMRKIAATRKG